MLSWNEYIKKGMVKKTMPNKGKIKTLIELAERGIEIHVKIEINEKSASILFKDFYDSLRSVCEAICLSKGYKIYSHEAVGLFFKIILREEAFYYKFDRFRILRNGVSYYGEAIPLPEAKQGIEEIKEIIKVLKNKYLQEFL